MRTNKLNNTTRVIRDLLHDILSCADRLKWRGQSVIKSHSYIEYGSAVTTRILTVFQYAKNRSS